MTNSVCQKPFKYFIFKKVALWNIAFNFKHPLLLNDKRNILQLYLIDPEVKWICIALYRYTNSQFPYRFYTYTLNNANYSKPAGEKAKVVDCPLVVGYSIGHKTITISQVKISTQNR